MHIPPPQPIRPGARARALPADLEPGQPVIPPEPGPPPRPAVWRLLLRWLISFIIFSATLKGCQYYGRQLNKPADVYYGRQVSKPASLDEDQRRALARELIRASRTPTPPPGD
ncbi:MAG TPA: hypothetical protein VIL01_08810 [Thermomicrobiales bacterium]